MALFSSLIAGLVQLQGQASRNSQTMEGLRLWSSSVMCCAVQFGEASPEYDVGAFSYTEESTDTDILVTFAVLNDVSLGRQSLDFCETCEHPIDV